MAISPQVSLIGAVCLFVLALVGIILQASRGRERRSGIVFALSWGMLIFSALIIMSNEAFTQFILHDLLRL
jgi:4-amino-4-deoxy-L-arabinose transferase-like glycosyltransferase